MRWDEDVEPSWHYEAGQDQDERDVTDSEAEDMQGVVAEFIK